MNAKTSNLDLYLRAVFALGHKNAVSYNKILLEYLKHFGHVDSMAHVSALLLQLHIKGYVDYVDIRTLQEFFPYSCNKVFSVYGSPFGEHIAGFVEMLMDDLKKINEAENG